MLAVCTVMTALVLCMNPKVTTKMECSRIGKYNICTDPMRIDKKCVRQVAVDLVPLDIKPTDLVQEMNWQCGVPE